MKITREKIFQILIDARLPINSKVIYIWLAITSDVDGTNIFLLNEIEHYLGIDHPQKDTMLLEKLGYIKWKDKDRIYFPYLEEDD